jgi:hypothetical protein
MNMVACHLLKNFMTADEIRRFLGLVAARAFLFHETFGRGGLGPRYRVLDGDQIRTHLPDIEDYGEARVRPVAEQLAGEKLRLLGSSRRSMRIQIYDRKEHGFRWHFDGHKYAALLTLKNTNCGETHVIAPGASRCLRFLLYPLYPLSQIFSLAPYDRIAAQPGDLLFLRGSSVLHRGVTLGRDGERILMVYTFDEADKKPSPIRDRAARLLNY